MNPGNEQDIDVHDKDNAALAATKEAQDMSTLERVVVPMPQFVNPNNPDTNSGSINLSLDAHPVEHSADYARDVGGAAVESPMDVGAGSVSAKPEEDWTVDDYKEALKAADLPVSGNKDELAARWDEHLADQSNES